MDYEQKYKNALERVRELLSRCIDYRDRTTKVYRVEDIESIFPELVESKGDRIKKALISILKSDFEEDTTIFGIRVGEIIAWLEKQGESIKIKKGKTYLCTKTHKYAGEEWIEGIKYYSPEDYSLVNQGCTYYCPEYNKEEHNNFFKEEEMTSTWSEEDEEMVNKVIKRLHNHSEGGEEYYNTYYWLKSLKDRVGCKVKSTTMWKPTEEQIEAIRLATYFVTDDFSEDPTLSERLMELEEQLKKLREE